MIVNKLFQDILDIEYLENENQQFLRIKFHKNAKNIWKLFPIDGIMVKNDLCVGMLKVKQISSYEHEDLFKAE